MPIINVKMAQGRTLEQKQQLAAAITREVVGILAVQPEWVTVIIDEYPRENWATGGQLHSIKYGPGFGKQGTETSPDKNCPSANRNSCTPGELTGIF